MAMEQSELKNRNKRNRSEKLEVLKRKSKLPWKSDLLLLSGLAGKTRKVGKNSLSLTRWKVN